MSTQKQESIQVLHCQVNGQLGLFETFSNFSDKFQHRISCLRFDQYGQKREKLRNTYLEDARVEELVLGHESSQFSPLASCIDPKLPHDCLGVGLYPFTVLFKFYCLNSERLDRVRECQKSTYEDWLSLADIFRTVGAGSESQTTTIYAVKVLHGAAGISNHAA